MYDSLENYLREVHHFLPLKGSDEILSELRSHILERTEDAYGVIDEESLGKAIEDYGSPQRVAEKYLEGCHVISPGFRRHLFLYTGMLFVLHTALTITAWFFRTDMLILPFFYIPRFGGIQCLFYLPMALIYDFGLTAFVLYLVTQNKGEARLPWPRFWKDVDKPSPPPKPGMAGLLSLLIGFGVVTAVFFVFRTVFFATIDLKDPQPLFDPRASLYFSVILLAVFGSEAAAYTVRLFHNSHSVILVKNGVILILLWLAWNYPFEITVHGPEEVDVLGFATAGLVAWTILAAWAFLKRLTLSWRERSSLDQETG